MRPLKGMPVRQAPQQKAQRETAQPDPKSYLLGDIEVPWNVGKTVYRYKAPRSVRISDITVDVGEIVSPSGAPVVIDLWMNKVYRGTITLQQGANTFDPFTLAKLDEVEMRILVKGERNDKTEVKDLGCFTA